MKQTKFKVTIFALALVLVFSVAAFFAINFRPANAAGTVSLTSANVFTASGEANILVDKQTVADGDNTTDKYYTMFTFGYDDDNVSFRKNLAYFWYEQETAEEEDTEEKPVTEGRFNLEIGFRNLAFEKFVITFEAQQYSKTEEGKTVNYVMFFPTADEGVKVLITTDKDASVSDVTQNTTLAPDHINIMFGEKLGNGTIGVTVSNGAPYTDNNPTVYYNMENVGGNYAKYSSSSTTPVYPLIFNAEFDEEVEDDNVAEMILYCLNNQVFEIAGATQKADTDYYTGGTVTDNTPAVLCLNSEISHLEVGGSVSFDYQLIDVLRSSPSSTLYYYLLTYDDTKADINYNDYKDERFKEVKTDTLLDSDREFYLPTLPADGGVGFGGEDNFKVDMAVKVYAKVLDTASNGEESYVFLDWYLNDALKLNINGYSFIAVGDDVDGVTYNYDAAGTDFNSWAEVCADYQAKVTEAAKNLSAGSSSYFYLPSAESLFSDNSTAYTDMKISIYYYSNSQSSNTSLASNNLSINVTREGDYRFTLYATDAAGNNMYYIDNDGEPVKFASSDIWDIYGDNKKHDFLPWFSFHVDYKGVQFKETPGLQSTAYVGTTYTSASFEINGVESSYETKYRLFLFDRAGYYADTKITFTYQQFIDKMDELFENEETRVYFKEIKEVTEADENYEEFKDYAWSSTSTSFVPQDGNAFYYMRAEVTDTQYNTDPVTCSLAVVASVEAKALKGDNEWLKNNIASVILLSVAGVSLIAIILLLVIKPKNKEDIDVQFEKEMSRKKKDK